MLTLLLALVLGPANPPFLYEDPAADRLIRQTMEASYNLQLPEARAYARALQTQYPDHPAGFVLMAETYWWEAQMDPGNKKIEDAYYRAQEISVDSAEKARKSNRYARTEVTANLASAWGSHARFQVTQKNAYFSAMRSGLKAHKYADEAYKLDPVYYDIWVGLGAFNYFTGSLPGVIKPFAFLIGARGDKNLGFEQLRTSIERSRYSQTEGRIVYYTALVDDKQYAAAFTIIQKLMADYRDNFVLYGWVTDWYRRQARNLDGAGYFEKVYGEEIRRSLVMAGFALLEKAQLQNAETRVADARATLVRLRAMPGVTPLLLARAQTLEKTFRK